jgi:DNA-binding NarL/FixJ family response regulator
VTVAFGYDPFASVFALTPMEGDGVDLVRLGLTSRLAITPLRSLLPLLDPSAPTPSAFAMLIPEQSEDGPAEEALRLLRRATWPPAAIVLMDGHDLPRAATLGRAGAFTVLPARAPVSRIARALLDASALAADEAPLRDRFQQLTPRERDVLSHLANGHSTRDIADRLRIAQATVKVHRKGVIRKLAARSAVDLVRVADRAWPGRGDGAGLTGR